MTSSTPTKGSPSRRVPMGSPARPRGEPLRPLELDPQDHQCSPTRFRVAVRIRPRPRRTSRSRRRVPSHVRTVPILARVRWRRSGSTRITPVPKGQRSGARPLRSSLGKPTGSPRSRPRGAPPTRRPSSLPARDRCQRQEARVLDTRWRRLPWRGPCEAGLAGTPWRSGATTPRPSLDPPRPAWPGSSASGDRSTTAALSMRRTRDRRRDRP